jgi:ubiquinone/menaquinone biosynthesis C-methylase UbiE
MPVVVDPAGKEIRALQDIIDWKGKRLLEVGCGDGRLTLRLAAFGPRSIEAVDPDPARIRLARKTLPADQAGLIRFHTAHAEKLKYPADEFDIAVFAWSL